MPDHRIRQRRSSCGFAGKAVGAATSDPVSTRRAHAGNDHFRRCLNDMKIASDTCTDSSSYIEDKSFIRDSRQGLSRKACGRPIKALIHEEMSMSREKEKRRSSPNVIARLMGLDALPPAQVLVKQQKDGISYSRKRTYEEDLSLQMSNSDQEFKDVFEIKDSLKAEKHIKQTQCKGTPCSTRNESDVAFIKQKLMEAKRLSTDETLQNSKEFDDALEVLDSNEDLVLQFLQEPNPLFTKHLHDLNCHTSSPHESHITILKSLKGKIHEIGEGSCNSETKPETCSYLHKGVSSDRKPTNGLVSHSLKEHSASVSHKMSKRSASKTKSSSQPTWIVVLKPSLDKAQNLAKSVFPMRSQENDQSVFRRHREFQQSRVQKLHVEGREQHKLFDNLEVMDHKTNCSREIAREITNQMKRSVSISEKVPFLGSNKHTKDESLCTMSGRRNLNEANNLDYNTSCSSSSCSTESSVSKEAIKRLSERWRMSQRFQKARVFGRGSSSSTLGEMLAQSDRDASRETLKSRKVSHEKLTRDLLGTGRYTSGISSRDGWKEGHSKKLSCSSSLSASTIAHSPNSSSSQPAGVADRCYMLKDLVLEADDSLPGKLGQRGSFSCRSFRSRNYKSHSRNSGAEGIMLPVREIHVNTEELRNETNSTNHSEMTPTFSKFSSGSNASSTVQVNSSSVESMDVELPSVTDEVHGPLGTQDEQFSDIHSDIDKALEETIADNPQVHSPHNQCDITDPESLKSAEDSEQPSPVSVLDLPCEENPSPESFERVNAGLQGLRMQLRLLRLEKSDTYDEESEALTVSEDDTGYCSSPELNSETPQTFRNEEERDLAYVHDILVDSGAHGVEQDRLNDVCYCSDYLVRPGVFEKLETKYGMLEEWPRSERKLFFDLVTSVVTEILAPFMDLNLRNVLPWGHEGLLEEVRQMIVRERKGVSAEKILDPGWLVSGESVDMIGSDIELTLKDDLMDELVSDLIFG